MKISIPCPHEAGRVPEHQSAPDFHPLSKDELIKLLRIAKEEGPRTANAVHCRLSQAIPGVICPREIEGETAEKSTWVDLIFTSAYRRKVLNRPWVADLLFVLMEPKAK